MAAKLIDYECVASSHAPTLTRADKLTIYHGRWAFCAFDARADGHEWRETGGADMDTLLRHDGLALSSRSLAKRSDS